MIKRIEMHDLSKKLLHWYIQNKRDLPWRKTNDPYAIWISEIILQQTRVAQGLPYYEKFIDHFPNIRVLADAKEEEVLALWQGLGYYSRARNLHQCAKTILDHFDGQLPGSYKELIQLRGIGPYTAAAIASISFKEPVAVLDGNVYRVLSRIFGIKDNIVDSMGRKRFKKISDDIIDPLNQGEFNQAIMEFGALHCTPVNPKCTDCPLKQDCYAYLNNLQKEFPVKRKKNIVINRYFHYLIIYHDNQIMMKKRDGNDIWKGLYEFILIETKNSNKLTDIKKEDFYMKLLNLGERIEFISKEKIHLLSHQKIYGRFYHLPIKNIDNLNKIKALKEFKFYNLLNINYLPKSAFITKYLKDAFF